MSDHYRHPRTPPSPAQRRYKQSGTALLHKTQTSSKSYSDRPYNRLYNNSSSYSYDYSSSKYVNTGKRNQKYDSRKEERIASSSYKRKSEEEISNKHDSWNSYLDKESMYKKSRQHSPPYSTSTSSRHSAHIDSRPSLSDNYSKHSRSNLVLDHPRKIDIYSSSKSASSKYSSDRSYRSSPGALYGSYSVNSKDSYRREDGRGSESFVTSKPKIYENDQRKPREYKEFKPPYKSRSPSVSSYKNYEQNESSLTKKPHFDRYVIGNSVVYGSPGHIPKDVLSGSRPPSPDVYSSPRHYSRYSPSPKRKDGSDSYSASRAPMHSSKIVENPPSRMPLKRSIDLGSMPIKNPRLMSHQDRYDNSVKPVERLAYKGRSPMPSKPRLQSNIQSKDRINVFNSRTNSSGRNYKDEIQEYSYSRKFQINESSKRPEIQVRAKPLPLLPTPPPPLFTESEMHANKPGNWTPRQNTFLSGRGGSRGGGVIQKSLVKFRRPDDLRLYIETKRRLAARSKFTISKVHHDTTSDFASNKDMSERPETSLLTHKPVEVFHPVKSGGNSLSQRGSNNLPVRRIANVQPVRHNTFAPQRKIVKKYVKMATAKRSEHVRPVGYIQSVARIAKAPTTVSNALRSNKPFKNLPARDSRERRPEHRTVEPRMVKKLPTKYHSLNKERRVPERMSLSKRRDSPRR